MAAHSNGAAAGLTGLAHIDALAGRTAAAREELAAVLARAQSEYVPPGAIAVVFGTYPFLVIETATVFAPAAPARARDARAITASISFRIEGLLYGVLLGENHDRAEQATKRT